MLSHSSWREADKKTLEVSTASSVGCLLLSAQERQERQQGGQLSARVSARLPSGTRASFRSTSTASCRTVSRDWDLWIFWIVYRVLETQLMWEKLAREVDAGKSNWKVPIVSLVNGGYEYSNKHLLHPGDTKEQRGKSEGHSNGKRHQRWWTKAVPAKSGLG